MPDLLVPIDPKAKAKKPGANLISSGDNDILVPLEHFKTLNDKLEEPGPNGEPSIKEGVGNAFSQLPTVPGVLAQHARPILATAGGIGFGVPGAAAGGAIGQGIEDQYEESTGKVTPASGTDAALSMAGAGVVEGGMQKFGPLILKGLSKLPAAALRAGQRMTQGAAPEAASIASASLPPMPQAPSFMPGSVAPGAAGVAQAAAQHETAKVMQADADAALSATQRSLQEGLALIPDAGTLGTGLSVQDGLRAGSDVWHREGGALYDKARAMTKDLPIPIKDFRAIGDTIAMKNQATALAFPRSGGYEPKIDKILKDIQDLGVVRDEDGQVIKTVNEVPFQALDGFRQKLVALAQDHTDTLAADQAKGILKQFTGVLTDTMEKGLGNTPEAQAWSQARKFWKEGAEVYDHATITKAINTNPEDVMAMIQPASATRPAAITEAKMIRGGLLDYVRQNGTPEEVKAAEETYNKFLRNFTESRFTGAGSGNPVELPKRLSGYRDVLDTLYDGTIEGKHIKDNLTTISGAVTKALDKAGAVSATEKALASAEQSAGASQKALNTAQAKAARASSIKAAQEGRFIDAKTKATAANAEQQVQAKYDKITKTVGNIADMVAAGLGITGNVPGVLGAISGKKPVMRASEILMDRIVKSRKASGMWAKEVEKAIANAANPPNISAKVFRPGDGLAAGDSTWLYNFGKALNETYDFKNDMEPFGPMPERKK